MKENESNNRQSKEKCCQPRWEVRQKERLGPLFQILLDASTQHSSLGRMLAVFCSSNSNNDEWISLQPSGSSSRLCHHYIINNNKQLKRTARYNKEMSKYISKGKYCSHTFKRKPGVQYRNPHGTFLQVMSWMKLLYLRLTVDDTKLL